MSSLRAVHRCAALRLRRDLKSKRRACAARVACRDATKCSPAHARARPGRGAPGAARSEG